MSQSRVKLLRKKLTKLQFNNALIMLDVVMNEMSAEKGFLRDDNVTPYFYHCVDVALIILNAGIKDEITITAALGHDLFEDVKHMTFQKVVHMFNSVSFGVAVSNIITKLTKDPNINYKNNYEALNQYLQIIMLDWRASVIKAADRIHNFGTLKDVTPEKKWRQANETKTTFFPFFKECRNKFSDIDENGVNGEILETFFHTAKLFIEPHLKEIQEHYNEVQILQKRIELLESKITS